MNPRMRTISDQRGSVDGIDTHWLEAPTDGGRAPALYVHGVPTGGWDWRPFLERTGGYAPDLPGFGASDKPASFDYSIGGYERWLRAFVDQRGLDRFSVVVHDWGGIGIALAQAMPERIERMAIVNAAPLLPGYRWHFIARCWRTRVVGELTMGFATKFAMRRSLNLANREPMPDEFVDAVWEHFDHGTQRAILKLYRSAPPEALAAAGTRLGSLEAPALIVWGDRDPYITTDFAHAYAEALGGPATVRIAEDAGHWPWLDEPALVDEIAGFLTA